MESWVAGLGLTLLLTFLIIFLDGVEFLRLLLHFSLEVSEELDVEFGVLDLVVLGKGAFAAI